MSTNKPTGGIEYKRLELALDRLRGTSIKTDIRTGGERVREGFGIIDSWTVIEKSHTDERMLAVEITLSKWLFNAVQAHEVLTIHKDYFRLTLHNHAFCVFAEHANSRRHVQWKTGV